MSSTGEELAFTCWSAASGSPASACAIQLWRFLRLRPAGRVNFCIPGRRSPRRTEAVHVVACDIAARSEKLEALQAGGPPVIRLKAFEQPYQSELMPRINLTGSILTILLKIFAENLTVADSYKIRDERVQSPRI